MKKPWLLVICLFPFVLTSCFEIREEVACYRDGAGIYQLTLDFSQSKTMIAMMLEYANGKDAQEEGALKLNNPFLKIDSIFDENAKRLNQIRGISHARGVIDHANFVYGVRFDFNDLQALNDAITSQTNHQLKGPYYVLNKKTFEKLNVFTLEQLVHGLSPEENISIDDKTLTAQIEELYTKVQYTFIFRAADKVKSASNPYTVISSDKKTASLSFSLRSVRSGGMDLSNKIKFK